MKRNLVISAVLLFAMSTAQSQVNAVVVDADGTMFAEGILKGYQIQFNGETWCVNPYVIGKYITCKPQVRKGGQTFSAKSKKKVWVDTNGTLGGMEVLDEKGRLICKDPSVSNQFRGNESYIICD